MSQNKWISLLALTGANAAIGSGVVTILLIPL